MQTSKKAASKTTTDTKAAEVKTAAPKTEAAPKTVAKAAEKKAPEKKAPEKKAPEKKAPEKKQPIKKPVAKKPVAKMAAPAETKVNFFVEFGGVQVAVDEVVKNVKATYGKDIKEIAVYLKPEESKAYFVADGDEGEMDVFFC